MDAQRNDRRSQRYGCDQASSCDVTSHRLLFLPAWGLVCGPMSPLQWPGVSARVPV